MFLQVPFPHGCRSHSSISAKRRSQLIQGLSELKVTTLGVQTGSRQLHDTPGLAGTAWDGEDTVALGCPWHYPAGAGESSRPS